MGKERKPEVNTNTFSVVAVDLGTYCGPQASLLNFHFKDLVAKSYRSKNRHVPS